MNQAATLFVSTLSTLLAIINPLESLPVFMRLLQGKDEQAHRLVARRACTYAALLMFFFLIFGTLLLEIFEVPLSMVRIVGRDHPDADRPAPRPTLRLALARTRMSPLCRWRCHCVGPGAIATVLGIASLVRNPFAQVLPLAAITLVILATMGATYLFLTYADMPMPRLYGIQKLELVR
jgi:multiple antibiotic resistance protein